MLSRSKMLFASAACVILGLASSAIAAGPKEKIRTIDHGVPHVSTAPVNAGEEVLLFLRERVKLKLLKNETEVRGARGAVLFVHGGSVPVVPGMDFGFKDYGWGTAVAEAGYDVFLLDLNGYGFSPRPEMTDACNTSAANQDDFLIPNPLAGPCAPNYSFRLNTIASERDEIDTAIEFIRDLRGVERVSLVGWSGGGQRTGSYTALHPEKVESLMILASSGYNRSGSSAPPAVLPQPGVPFRIQSYEALIFNRWFSNVACEGQVEPGAETAAWNEIMRFDPLGSTWGTPAWNPIASPAGGLMRVALRTNWGWNAEAASQVVVPTLIMVGEQDGLFNSNMLLFEDLGTQHKVFLGIACATHFIAWESQHRVLQKATVDWLRHGKVAGKRHGVLSADVDGKIRH